MIKKAFVEKVGIFLIILNIYFVYVKFFGFSIFVPAILGLFLINVFNIGKISFNKISIIFLTILFIIVLSAGFFPTNSALLYSFKFFVGILILLSISKVEDSSKRFLIKMIKNMSLIFGLYTILSVFIPSFNTTLVKFLYNSSISEMALSLFDYQGYSGLAGQTGNNAFLIMFGGTIVICEMFKGKKIRFSSIVSFIIILVSVLLTNKRSYLLILGVDFLYFLYLYMKNLKLTKKMLMIILSVSILFLFFSCYALTNYKVFTRFSSENFMNGRDIYAAKAIELIEENPIFGVGINNYPIASNYDIYAHNVFLQLASEVGIIFSLYIFICLFYILFSTTKMVYKTKKIDYLIGISILVQIVFLLEFFTGNSFYDANMLYAYFIGLSFFVQKAKVEIE